MSLNTPETPFECPKSSRSITPPYRSRINGRGSNNPGQTFILHDKHKSFYINVYVTICAFKTSNFLHGEGIGGRLIIENLRVKWFEAEWYSVELKWKTGRNAALFSIVLRIDFCQVITVYLK